MSKNVDIRNGASAFARREITSTKSALPQAASSTSASQDLENAHLQLQQLISGVLEDQDDDPGLLDANATELDTASNMQGSQASNDAAPVCYVTSLWAYTGEAPNHVSFSQGDILVVFGMEPSGWWDGILIKSTLPEFGKRGWFPSSMLHFAGPAAVE